MKWGEEAIIPWRLYNKVFRLLNKEQNRVILLSHYIMTSLQPFPQSGVRGQKHKDYCDGVTSMLGNLAVAGHHHWYFIAQWEGIIRKQTAGSLSARKRHRTSEMCYWLLSIHLGIALQHSPNFRVFGCFSLSMWIHDKVVQSTFSLKKNLFSNVSSALRTKSSLWS